MTHRAIEETWTAVGIGIGMVNSPVSENGNPPIVAMFVLVINEPGCTRTIKVPINEEMRQGLLRDLAGGVIIARPGEMGGGI